MVWWGNVNIHVRYMQGRMCYISHFTIENFTVSKVFENLPVPLYKLQEYNGEDIIGSFFEDELVKFKSSEFYNIEILKSRGKGKKIEFLVLYVARTNTYDELKKATDVKDL